MADSNPERNVLCQQTGGAIVLLILMQTTWRCVFINTLFILATQKIVVPYNINEKLQLKKLNGTAY